MTSIRARVRALREWAEHERPDAPVVARIVRGALTVEARDRTLIIAGQGFIALVPLLIVVAILLSSSDGVSVAEVIAARLDLDPVSAEALRVLFTRPPEASGGIGLLGFLLVVVSATSLARSIRRTFERAWGLERARGARASVEGLLALVVLVTAAVLGGWVRGAAGLLPGLLLGLAVGVAGWGVGCWLLLGRRYHVRALLPGALYGAAAQVLVGFAMNLYLPVLIGRYLNRYGLIGVSFALVTGMIVIGALVVSVAVVSAQLAPPDDSPHGGPPAVDD